MLQQAAEISTKEIKPLSICTRSVPAHLWVVGEVSNLQNAEVRLSCGRLPDAVMDVVDSGEIAIPNNVADRRLF